MATGAATADTVLVLDSNHHYKTFYLPTQKNAEIQAKLSRDCNKLQAAQICGIAAGTLYFVSVGYSLMYVVSGCVNPSDDVEAEACERTYSLITPSVVIDIVGTIGAIATCCVCCFKKK